MLYCYVIMSLLCNHLLNCIVHVQLNNALSVLCREMSICGVVVWNPVESDRTPQEPCEEREAETCDLPLSHHVPLCQTSHEPVHFWFLVS